MNWYKKAQIDIDLISAKYPKANGISGELSVRNDVPNTSSISASLTDYYEVPGIRNIPLSEFHLTGKSYSIEEDNRIKSLENQIKFSKQINPIIAVLDNEGLYILEGGHRADALYNLGSKVIPAMLIVDLES